MFQGLICGLSYICPELGVTPLLDSGTDLEDELPSPDASSMVMGHRVTRLPAQVEKDFDLSNDQVLQQLVTALHGASSNVMGAVRGHQPFPHHAMQHALPSCRVRRVAHYMTAMGLWRPPVAPGIRGPLPMATCPTCMSCSNCFPDVPL